MLDHFQDLSLRIDPFPPRKPYKCWANLYNEFSALGVHEVPDGSQGDMNILNGCHVPDCPLTTDFLIYPVIRRISNVA